MVDVLILNFNDAATTSILIERMKNFTIINQIVVVDNCSTDDSYLKLSQFQSQKIHIIRTNCNKGYGAGNNFGIRYLYEKFYSKYILLCNPDVVIDEESIFIMEKYLLNHTKYVLAAPFMCNINGIRQFNTAFKIPTCNELILSFDIIISKVFNLFYYDNIVKEKGKVKQVEALSGSLFMMNVEEMIKFGMFDENIFLYCEEITLGIKLKKSGLKIALLPQINFIHQHSVSINKSFHSIRERHTLLMQSRMYVLKKYYNLNKFQYALAFFLGKISLVEIEFIQCLKRVMNINWNK